MMVLLALIGCGVEDTWTPPEFAPVTAGAPQVGAAEGFLRLPVGTPMAGNSSRCHCLLGIGRPDGRESVYAEGFIESAGVHTHPAIKVIWIDNGDDHLILTKTDSIYSADKLVKELEVQLSASTGIDLTGKVVHTANHTHHSYGDFTDAITFFIGSDQYNEEIFQRFAAQVADVAKDAFDKREPAKIGLSLTRDWDPDDRVYRDRRGENNDAVVGNPPLPTGKDPILALLRVDDLDDNPLAVMVNFGMHGVVLSEMQALVSSDSGGGIEAYLTEAFDDEVVVMFTQGSGGDQSPAGEQDAYAKVESIGDRATPLLMDAWADTTTSEQPFTLQTASRAIPTHPSIMEVTRNGTVDWRYAPVVEGEVADNEVYAADGSLLSPIDEFRTNNGALFCGTGDLAILPGAPLPGVEVLPYGECARVESLMPLIDNYFNLDRELYGVPAESEIGVPLPLPDTLRANTLASVVNGLLVTDADGNTAHGEVIFGFFPGESTHMFTETWRRRTEAELGVDHAVMVSYAMDHEGYLLIPEDWLLGGYEPDITVWGPLASEYIMEQVLDYSSELLQDEIHQPSDPLGKFLTTQYPDHALPTAAPDVTPEAGTQVTTVPESFWTPTDIELDLTEPTTVQRVSGMVQIAWKGGDPGVDDPVITLEREVEGNWETLRTGSGRVIDDSRHDILKGYTPDPLAPTDALQEHYWWAVWQAVGHVDDRAGLPLGSYRFKVDGQSFGGTATTWPWDEVPYSFTTTPFEVVEGVLAVEVVSDGLTISHDAHEDGYRYIGAGGNQSGSNPVPGEIEVRWNGPGVPVTETVTGVPQGNRTKLTLTPPTDAISVDVTDAYGNTGSAALP